MIQPEFHVLRFKIDEKLPSPDRSVLLSQAENKEIEDLVQDKLKLLLNEANHTESEMNALLIEGKDLSHIFNYLECQKILV